MSELYEAFRRVWPHDLPVFMPWGIEVNRTTLKRAQQYRPKPGAIFVVVFGRLVESVLSGAGREVHVHTYRQGDIGPHVVGTLNAVERSSVLEMSSGWKHLLPEMQGTVLAAIERQLAIISRRMASAARDTVQERVAQLLAEEPDIKRSPTIVARHTGATREMCSKALQRIAAEEASS